MKHLILIALLLCSSKVMSQTTEKEIVPNLTSVKVFTTAAQLCYNSPIELQKGTTTLRLKNLSTKMDIQSLLVNFSDSIVKIQSILPKITPKESVEESVFVDSIARIESQINATNDLINTCKNEQKLLYNLINNSKSGTTQEIDKNLSYFREKSTLLSNKILDLELLVMKYGEIRKIYSKKMEVETKKQTDLLSEVVIIVTVSKNIQCSFEMKYTVNAAGWIPLYDMNFNNLSSQMTLIQKAKIFNNTGVNWNKVPMSLSTARPDKLIELPQLSPMNFGRAEKIEDNLKLENRAKTGNQKMDSTYKYKTMSVPDFTLDYTVPRNYLIPTDTQPYTVFINQLDMPSRFMYYATPKIDENVYLTALISGFNDLNLLDGEVNVFLNNALITRTQININMLDTFKVSLGMVKNARVKRNKVQSKTQKAFIGSKIKYSFSFEIVVQNFYDFPIDIQIIDQVPVSTDKDVDVEVLDTSHAQMSKNGLLYWNFRLNSKEKEVKSFSYSIKYPEEEATYRHVMRREVPCPMF